MVVRDVSAERLKLVESFDELRAGMLVVVKGCDFCHGEHRGILISFDPLCAGEDADGEVDVEPSWTFEPSPPCVNGDDFYVCLGCIDDRTLYRVLDDADDSTYLADLKADEDLAKVRAHEREQQKAGAR